VAGAVDFAAGLAVTTPAEIAPLSAKHKITINFFKVLSSELAALLIGPSGGATQ
jgi:hypothetical protein